MPTSPSTAAAAVAARLELVGHLEGQLDGLSDMSIAHKRGDVLYA